MKKFINYLCFVGVMVGVTISSYMVVKAASLKNIKVNDWYSTSMGVGYWEDTARVYFVNVNNSGDISKNVNNAVTKWNSAGISTKIVTSPTVSDIIFYGGKWSELNSLGFGYSGTIVGLTNYDSRTKVATANNKYGVYCMDKVSTSMLTDTETAYKNNIALHELGHSLGWFGHMDSDVTNYKNTVMYENVTTKGTLSTADKQHLLQIYNKMND